MEYTIDGLKKIHDKIKEHPYRYDNNQQYLKSYQDLLSSFSDYFYWIIKETKFLVAKNLVHDFNLSIYNISRENYKYLDETKLHIENCISCIHTFIETGTMEKFPDYSLQVLRPIIGLSVFYKWNENENKYHMIIPSNKKKEVIDALNKLANDFYGKDDTTANYWKNEAKYIENN